VRYTLPNGDWVDLVERLNYAQARRINMAGATPDAAGTIVAAMVTNWALRDVDEQPIDFPGAGPEGVPLDALSRIPFDVFQEIGIKAADLLPGQPDPKGSAGTSPGSRSGGKPTSPSSSRKRTSLQTIQDGPGPTFNGHPRT
jgi:hypothetical protein